MGVREESSYRYNLEFLPAANLAQSTAHFMTGANLSKLTLERAARLRSRRASKLAESLTNYHSNSTIVIAMRTRH